MNRRTVLAVATSVWVASAAPAPQAASDPVRVAILCGPQRTYRQAASALEQTLRRYGCECILVELPRAGDPPVRRRALQRLAEAQPTVIASSGATATSLALETVPNTPVVFFMLPNALDASFLADDHPNRAHVAGVAADVSPTEHIDWIARLGLSGKHIAVLHSARTRRTVEALSAAARERGMTVSAIEADKRQFPKAIDALNKSGADSVLMIPDAKVYDAVTVQRLLLWGIRQRKPVWGFSAPIVKAGALGGQYADSEAVGQQAAEIVQQVIDGTPPDELGLQYPRQVTRAVNKRTAEMIHVALGDEAINAETVCFGE